MTPASRRSEYHYMRGSFLQGWAPTCGNTAGERVAAKVRSVTVTETVCALPHGQGVSLLPSVDVDRGVAIVETTDGEHLLEFDPAKGWLCDCSAKAPCAHATAVGHALSAPEALRLAALVAARPGRQPAQAPRGFLPEAERAALEARPAKASPVVGIDSHKVRKLSDWQRDYDARRAEASQVTVRRVDPASVRRERVNGPFGEIDVYSTESARG